MKIELYYGVRFQFYSMNSDFKLMKYLRLHLEKVLRKEIFKKQIIQQD